MQIGLSISKTFTPDSYTSITVGYWMIEEIKQNRITKYGYITLVPYTDQAFWVSNGDKSFYHAGKIVFAVNPANWPFVVGTDPISKAWAFIKSHTATQDDDGNQINGGLDWSRATDVTV
jgi:hypothetical protein